MSEWYKKECEKILSSHKKVSILKKIKLRGLIKMNKINKIVMKLRRVKDTIGTVISTNLVRLMPLKNKIKLAIQKSKLGNFLGKCRGKAGKIFSHVRSKLTPTYLKIRDKVYNGVDFIYVQVNCLMVLYYEYKVLFHKLIRTYREWKIDYR